MNSDYFQDLKKLLERFPGIGPRQASRFIWALLDFEQKDREKLSALISSLDKNLVRCGECFRAHLAAKSPSGDLAAICLFCRQNSARERLKIMVVEKDSDLINIEKTKIYNGLYHVLGGVINPLESSSDLVRERIKALYSRVEALKPKEIILAISPTKLGELTASYVIKVLESLKVKITRLGRGLATGADLEYIDETTLRQALDNRK